MEFEELESNVLKNIVFITQKTTNIGLLNIHLIQSGVILPVEKETIESHSTHENQVYNLMLLLTRKGPGTKEKLLKALRETCNGHIAQVLDANNCSSQIIQFSQPFTLDLTNSPINYDRINPLLDKVQELVDVLRVEDIVAASKTQYISIKEDRTQKETLEINKKVVVVSQVEKHDKPVLRIKKLVVIGDGATGKTCMNVVWTAGVFPEEYVATVFDNHQTFIKVGDSLIQLGIWDTAGQEEYDTLRPLSYPKTDIFVIVFSLDSFSSLSNANKKWVPELKHYCPKVPIFLVGNKLDLRNVQHHSQQSKVVTTQKGQEVAKKIGAQAYFECSAKTGEGMEEVLPTIMKKIIELENGSKYRQFCCKTM